MNKYRRFIWSGIAAIAIGGFAMFNASLNSQNGLSTIHKANMEALATESSNSATYVRMTLDCYKNVLAGAIKTGTHVSCISDGMYKHHVTKIKRSFLFII
jgi:hypothetical protein